MEKTHERRDLILTLDSSLFTAYVKMQRNKKILVRMITDRDAIQYKLSQRSCDYLKLIYPLICIMPLIYKMNMEVDTLKQNNLPLFLIDASVLHHLSAVSRLFE